MHNRAILRLNDILDTIAQIDILLQNKSFEDLERERVLKAAFERFLEILSEASRHIPDGLKSDAPEIPWRRISDIGNHLRHAYHRADSAILWEIFAGGDLAQLKNAVIRLLEKSK